MSTLLWVGTAIGMACGLGHGAYVYSEVRRDRAKRERVDSQRPAALSYAVWTLALWILFGVYVTVLWIIALCFYLPSRILGRPSTVLPTRAAPAMPVIGATDAPRLSNTSADGSEATDGTASFDLAKIRRVAIIGAGASGLATARVLLAQGLDCTVVERRASLGGVWADGYLNFGVQVQRELYEFPDWPLPSDAANFTPGPVYHAYLVGYAEHFGVLPCIRFGTTVADLGERASGVPGWRVAYRDAGGERV